MHRKAQAEFALILGLILIAAVVGVYSFSSLRPPTVAQSAMNDEQKAVANFATDLVREATASTISELYRNGGYLDGSTPALGMVTHKAFGDVAYWQMCEHYTVPDIQEEIKEGVKKYIEDHLSGTENIAGRQAVFDKGSLAVDARVYDNRVAVAVKLPTVFEGASLEQPYRAETYAKIGRIADFARNFAMMQASLRPLDTHLIKSLMQSSEYSSCWIPFGAGNANSAHTITWDELRDCMEMHAKYSLSNTQIGREVELTDDEVPALPSYNYGGWSGTSMEFFFMPAINVYDLAGNIIDSDRYDDLAVTFTFGDDDGLDATEFSGPDVINMKPATGSFSRFLFGFTVAEYAQTYSVRYPVIVRVWDPSTGESMNFATYVYMENNRVGMGCTAPPALPPADQNTDSETYNDRCTTGATEEATVTIKYDDDSAVSNALVSYAGCSMGLTDDLGKASGHVSREMFSSLTVEADGNEYSECHSYSDLDGMVMTIPRSASADVMFKRVKITKTGNTYTMMPPTPATSDEVITVEMTRNADICDGGTVVMMNLDDETGVFVTGKMLRNLPIDTYDVAISVQKEGAVLGFVTEAGFPHSPTIYVYAPSMEGFEDAEDLDAETANIEALYEHCGISPVSAVPYTTGVCQWTAA